MFKNVSLTFGKFKFHTYPRPCSIKSNAIRLPYNQYHSHLDRSTVHYSLMAQNFQLSSSQTALALVLPDEISPSVNQFRKRHDKAYGKWPAHINIIYPFVPVHQLEAALTLVQKCLAEDARGSIEVSCDDLDVFKHRKSATLFLQPDEKSTERLSKLRKVLTSALGCKESDGTHDGEFRPHMTLGQSDLSSRAIDALITKAQSLTGLKWDNAILTVLKRQVTGGPMVIAGELPFSKANSSDSITIVPATGWRHCFNFTDNDEWQLYQPSIKPHEIESLNVSVTSINIMEDSIAPAAPHLVERLPIIIESLERLQYALSGPRVLCLQEVSPSSLSLIMNNDTIRQLYPFSTHHPNTLLPSLRNQITLASTPFTHFNLQFAEMHKAVSIIQLLGSSLSVANIHLSSGLTPDSIETKRRQMSKLSAFLSRRKLMEHTILAGDFNLPTSSRTLETAVKNHIVSAEDIQKLKNDIISIDWDDAFISSSSNMKQNRVPERDYFPGEEGATFDRRENYLAAMRTPVDSRPQRYDRILFRKDGFLENQRYFRTVLARRDGTFASDHNGISAVLSLKENQARSADTDVPLPRALDLNRLRLVNEPEATSQIEIPQDNTDIHGLIEKDLPSQEDRSQRIKAINILNQVLNDKRSSETGFKLIPIGSYALDIFFASSDVDILVIGTVTDDIFFNFAKAQLSKTRSSSLHLINSKVTVLEVNIEGVKLDIQYCQKDISNDVYTPTGEMSINSYRDTALLKETYPSSNVHRFLALFLKRRGLYSPRFGYLGGIHLALMINHLVKVLASQLGGDPKSPLTDISDATLIRIFFSYYANFDWSTQMVVDPTLFNSSKVDRKRNPVYIRCINTPSTRINVAESCNGFSAKIITGQFEAARDALTKGEWRWCLRPLSESVSDFLNQADVFAQFDLDIWNISKTPASAIRNITGIIESKLLSFSDKLSPEEEIDIQIWPMRFQSTQLDHNRVTGHYLISITGKWINDEQTPLDLKKLTSVAKAVLVIIKRAKFWDDSIAGLQSAVLTKKKVLEHGLTVDYRDWTSLAMQDGDSSVEGDIFPSNDISGTNTASYDSVHIGESSKKTQSFAGPTPSLRPIQDIMSRIQWDSDGGYNVDNFVVGYEDRFEGTMEIPLAAWKRESTHEEFIPMHRIVWIKNKDSGEKVWDRYTRFDAVFGSGIPRKEN
jgi:2'-5' RNA ligase/endonuclease/exonuclease/phosphatase family metal-dependent hydrolase/uncharacterized protein (UPF0248 family)